MAADGLNLLAVHRVGAPVFDLRRHEQLAGDAFIEIIETLKQFEHRQLLFEVVELRCCLHEGQDGRDRMYEAFRWSFGQILDASCSVAWNSRIADK
jgi:hypothetical protein